MKMTLALCLLVHGDPISQKIGDVQIRPVGDAGRIDMPYLSRGSDVPMFMANGGVETSRNSTFAEYGLDVRLVPGDDFPLQVRRYLEGESPFLRGTLGMIAIASEAIGSNPEIRPRAILHCGWGLGDYLISRGEVRKIDQIRGKSIAIRYGSPQADFIGEILKSRGISKEEVKIDWCDNPSERFRRGESDLCCVGSPEMLAITGGPEFEGSGAEGTIGGSRVLISSRSMEHSIADVLIVREDYYRKNKGKIEKLIAGYLKSANELIPSRESDQGKQILAIAQKAYGDELLPELETDAAQFIDDTSFSGLLGQIAFFNDPANPIGFAAKMRTEIDVAISERYINKKLNVMPPDFDYRLIADLAGLHYVEADSSRGGDSGKKDPNEILSFSINFQPNQTEFHGETYGSDFQKVVDSLSRYGDARMIVEGHSDTNEVLKAFVKSGIESGIITKKGTSPNITYLFEGEPLNLSGTRRIQELVLSGAFDRDGNGPRAVMQASLNLSLLRAKSVKSAIIDFAKQNKIEIDPERIIPRGMGISAPLIPIPRKAEDALQNMRVVFRLVRTK